MRRLVRLFLISFILSTQGCQSLNEYMVQPIIQYDFFDQEHLDELFSQGMLYQQLSKKQQQTECKKLQQDFKNQAQWQTAWLLVNSLNINFSCISLNETLILLNAIQNSKSAPAHLLLLNKNQIQLLTTFRKKNNQLLEAEKQLTKLNFKIQSLKAIEANIIKKLDNE